MSDGDALLAAILAVPDEDVPRLAYADWLDEHNLPNRAEFIRVQCEIARRWPDPKFPPKCLMTFTELVGYAKFTSHCRCEVCKLKRLEYLSSRSHIVWDWCGGVDGGWAWLAGSHDFQRGFIRSIRGEAKDWIDKADAILATHPVVEVTLTTMPTWSRNTKFGDGYAHLIGREKIESIGCIVGSADDRPLVLKLLRAEWPRIRKWNLPTQNNNLGRWMTDDNEYLNGIMQAARRAGEAAAMRQNEAFLRGFLGE